MHEEEEEETERSGDTKGECKVLIFLEGRKESKNEGRQNSGKGGKVTVGAGGWGGRGRGIRTAQTADNLDSDFVLITILPAFNLCFQ